LKGTRPPTDRGPSAESALAAALDLALEAIGREDRLPQRIDPAAPGIDLALGPHGRSFDDVVTSLSAILAATPSSASPRFFSQLFAGRDPVATMAEMLAPVANTSMYTFKVAGPQVLVEREVLRHMLGHVGWPDGEGSFCPGGSLANLTAMLLARNEALPEARERGVQGCSPRIYTSAASHYSIRKSAGILGLGRAHVREVPCDRADRMDVAALERMLSEDGDRGHLPLVVVATSGPPVAGADDPVRGMAAVARERGVWLHVDGALGASALLSRHHRHLLDGMESADSLSWNPHKMMGVPLSCSVVLLRRSGLLTKHLNESADYLFQADGDPLNPGTRSIQCGRRNDALKLWAAWRHHGDAGYENRIDRVFDLAAFAARAIADDSELELVLPPESVNVCFRVRGRSSAAVCELLDAEAVLKIGHGIAAGRRAIRLVCLNPDLEERDIEGVLDEVKLAARRLPPAHGDE